MNGHRYFDGSPLGGSLGDGLGGLEQSGVNDISALSTKGSNCVGGGGTPAHCFRYGCHLWSAFSRLPLGNMHVI